MPASIFTNNDKPISRREDEGKVGFTPSISPNQRETLTLQQVLRNCRVRPGKRMDEIFVAQEPTFVDFSCRTDFHWGCSYSSVKGDSPFRWAFLAMLTQALPDLRSLPAVRPRTEPCPS